MENAFTGPVPVSEADRPAVAAALAARDRAYCRYSGYAVGASLLTPAGKFYLGCNVENASFGLTNCAERVALQNALVHGESQFTLLVVAATGNVTPCGACRQVLAEFCSELRTLLVDPERPHECIETNLGKLLPGRFSL